MFASKFTNKNKERHGFTVIEALFGLICVAFLITTIVSIATYLRAASYTVRAGALIESYVISIAETISQDLEDGVDITDVDYNSDERFDSDSIHKEITVIWQENVFDEMLYWIKVDCFHKETNTNQVTSFFLRGGEF